MDGAAREFRGRRSGRAPARGVGAPAGFGRLAAGKAFVTTAERDLVDALRAELAAVDPHRRCCRAAESAGLAGAFEPRRRTIARLTLRLGRSRAGEGSHEATPPGRTPEPVGGSDAAGGSAMGSSVAATSAPPQQFDWADSAEHCRVAYLRGRFLAHGSLSLASGRTHLEFVLPPDEARSLCEQLNGLELPARWRLRRGRGVVTWKSVETVITFLKVVGAGSTLLELESRQVSRSVRGDINRVINAESANLTRAVAASARQLEAIDALESDGRLAEQPYQVRLVADARREEPEATFSELAERLGLHRSAVQRAIERIERLVPHPDEGVGKRSGHRAPRYSEPL
jgi:WhiA LAGLIDADG-like domain/WhiA C-terminal HTH domain